MTYIPSAPSTVNTTAAFGSGISKVIPLDLRRWFLANVCAWAQDDEQRTCINVHYYKLNPNSVTPWSNSQAFTTVDDAAKYVANLQKKPDTLSVSCCISSQSKCEPPKVIKGPKGDFEITPAICTAENALKIKSIVISVPFKNYGNDPDAARAALAEFVSDTGLPKPSIVVVGPDRLCAIWVLDTALPVGGWLRLAHATVAAGKAHGLKASWRHTTDSIRLLELPGTETKLDGTFLTISEERMWHALESHRGAAQAEITRADNLTREAQRAAEQQAEAQRAESQRLDDMIAVIDDPVALAALAGTQVTASPSIATTGAPPQPVTPASNLRGMDAATPDKSTMLDQALDRYCYIKNIDRLWDKQDRMILNASQFGACEPSLRANKTAPYTVLMDAQPSRYRSLTYRPGQPEIVMEDHEGAQFECVNTYQPGPDPIPGSVYLWLKHGVWLLGKEQFRHVRHYLAWVYQNPGKKPGWTPIIVGPQGVGKDWLVTAFRQALGPHNVAYIDFANVTQKFNADWATKQFVVVNEARQNKPAQAKEVYNKIKPIFASLPPTRRVEEKNVPAWHAPNIQAGIVFTNYEDAIALDHDDRRFAVFVCVRSVRPDNAQEFFTPHFAWCPRDDEKGEAARAQRRLAGAQLAAYLEQVDLSKFRPEEPPLTQGKKAMISAANPELEWLDSLFSEEGACWNREVVATNDVLDAWHVHAENSRHKGVTLNHGAVTAKLRSLEYTARKAQLRVGPGKKIRPWLSKEAMARGLDKRPDEIKGVYQRASTSQPSAAPQPSADVIDLQARQKILKEAADALGVPVDATAQQIAEARAAKKAASPPPTTPAQSNP